MDDNGDVFAQKNKIILRSTKIKQSTPIGSSSPTTSLTSDENKHKELLRNIRDLKNIVTEVKELKATILAMSEKYEQLLVKIDNIIKENTTISQENIELKQNNIVLQEQLINNVAEINNLKQQRLSKNVVIWNSKSQQ